METANEPLSTPSRAITEIRLLSEIAKANGSLISLKDVINLTLTDLSEQQLESRWSTLPDLATSYELKNGFILERSHWNHLRSERTSLDRELEKRARAESYARYARDFASLCGDREARMIAISGSTSYQTVSESDDLDIFCVTRPDSLWLFLTKSLFLARFSRIARGNAPRICFSYAMDQNFAEKEFLTQRDALFARDALTARVVQGQEFYRVLLKRSTWISSYFPRLYEQRTNSGHPEQTREKPATSSSSQRFLNLLLQTLVGKYIALKSAMLNRKLSNQGKFSSLFTVRIGLDHCIFESTRYRRLRSMYMKRDCQGKLPSQQSFPESPGE